VKIGLDFDGVISDCGKLKSEAGRKFYGLDIPPGQFKKELVIGGGHLTEAQYRSLQKRIYGTEEFGLLMEPVPGALQHIETLLLAGHELTVVTSRSNESLQVAESWSARQGLKIPFIGCGYNVTKAAACTGLDIFIDDDLDKLVPLVDIVPHRFLFSWGYNQHLKEGSVASRVCSWDNFFKHIQRIEGVGAS